MTDLTDAIPLTPAVFHILLALAKREQHGYEIMKEVRRDSGDRIRMGNGTLYGSIKRMLADGLIEDAGERPEGGDERRKYYRITSRGQAALTTEIRRYVATVEAIRNRDLMPSASTPAGAWA
ncbi:MAG: PadR family transcriptional regulator [Bauldia sp.]|nr:PadR family transcriptional regulator [Bauldia sp.]MCW5717432.1 PadR family transcriptional regulator [Bauldia sp.]